MDSADTLLCFTESLKAFLDKDNFNGALQFVVDHIFRCMEENGEATKGTSLVVVLNTVASDFPKLNLPSNPLHRLECLVNNLLSNGMVVDALKLTSAPYPSALTVPVLELKLRIIFHEQNMEEDEGYLEKSIDYFSKGISMAKIHEQQSLLEKLEQQLCEAEKKKVKFQQAFEEANRHGSKKAVETKDEGTKDEGTKDEGTKDEETKDEGTKDEGGTGEIIPLVEERRPRNFEIPFSVTMESAEDSFVGCIRTNTTGVQKSFIVVDQSQINYFQDLVYLCLRHETLLKVDQSFMDEGEGRILPYMASGKQKQDLVQLVDLMQSVIKLAVPDQSDISFLPDHLKQFFDNVTQFHGSCPLEIVIDHPYFWNTAEKISFTFKLRELVKQNPNPFLLYLNKNELYQDWWDSLQHVYKKLFENAKKRKRIIKAYRNAIDIVRFYGAVYTHINELEYKQDRNNKV
uniref:Uncharacterized protein n=1 Tax=Chenopodium quinoa TaxID=63459 RepID=A0A803NCJ1_CHEQI